MIPFPLRRPVLLGLLMLTASARISSLRAASPGPLCEPSPAIRAAIDSLEGEQFDRMPPGKARTARVERIRALLRKNPDDFFLHRTLQTRILGTEGGREILAAEYRRLAEEHPADPRYLYLYGRALKMRSESGSRAQYERALEVDPSFPWPYLGLAIEVLFEPGKDPAKLRRYLKKFWDICPDTLEPYRYAGGGENPKFMREAAGRLRAVLEKRSDREAIHYYATLWSLEFKIHPPPEHEAVRGTIRKDLERIRALKSVQEKEWYLTLRDGYGMAGDSEGKEWAEKEFLARFARSGDALEMVMDRWNDEHPPPGERNSPEAKAHFLALYRESAAWIKGWPEFLLPRFYRLEAAGELDQLPDREALSAADGFMKALKEDPTGLGGVPPLEFTVARLYVDRGLRPDRVPELIQEPLRKMEEDLKKEAPADAKERRYQEDNLEYARWSGWPLLLESYLKRGRLPEARETVARMERALSEPAAAREASADAAKSEGKGSGASKRAKDEEDSDRILATAWHRAETLHGKGRIAEAEKRTADAWVHYRAALLELPAGSRGSIQETREKIESDARRLWKKLGGTQEGWEAALEKAPGEAQAAVESAAGGWEDKSLSLPSFELFDLSGKRWTQADLRGKVTFINVWATWCGPCRSELPELQKLEAKLRGKPGVQLLTFNVDGNPGVVAPFLARNGYSFPALSAEDYIRSILEEVSIPRNWIVDPSGKVIREQLGFGGEGDRWVDAALSEIDRTSAKR